jgi:hypothetical protein
MRRGRAVPLAAKYPPGRVGSAAQTRPEQQQRRAPERVEDRTANEDPLDARADGCERRREAAPGFEPFVSTFKPRPGTSFYFFNAVRCAGRLCRGDRQARLDRRLG